MAARTADQILQDYKDSALLSDPTIDTEKGPLYDLVGRPLSQVLAPVESEVDRLEKIYSAEFATVATDEEAQAFLNNWGETAGLGSPSTARVFFMTFTRPSVDQTITVPLGSLVSNSDQTLQYVTIESGVIRGDLADSYYNAQRRTYEIGLQVQAVANGPTYQLPAGRINTKISNLPGIDAVENREASTPGAAAETNQQQIARVQQKFKGLAVNTGDGSYTRIKRFAPTTVLDVNTILSSNRSLFRRIVYGPGKDYYILGTNYKTVVQTYTSTVGGETSIALTNVPVLAINSVTVNNVALTNYTLSSDTSKETGGSAVAKDRLVLAFPLLANDVVSITLTYNALIQDIQTQVLSESKLFNTDELARQFFPVPLRIEVTGRALASYDPIQVQNAVLAEINSLIPTDAWTEAFYPTDFRQSIQKNVSGLTNLQIVKFQRSSLATADVEIALFKENEIATYDSNFVNVQIRSV